ASPDGLTREGPARLSGPAVGMVEVALGPRPVAHALLQHLGLGKAAVALSLPDRLAVERDLEHAARARNQRHLPEVDPEGRQTLLRHPCRTQQPLALRAIDDADRRASRGKVRRPALFAHAALSLAIVSSSTSKLA